MSLPQAIQDDTHRAAQALLHAYGDDVEFGVSVEIKLMRRLNSGEAIVVPRDEWMPKRLRDAYEAVSQAARTQLDDMAKFRRDAGFSSWPATTQFVADALKELEAAKGGG